MYRATHSVSTELWTPLMTQIRYHNRPNLQRPLPIHYKRARMLALVKPIYPPKIQVCPRLLKEENNDRLDIENHGHALFLAKQMQKQFHSHPMIALFHANSFKESEFLKIRGMLFDSNFDMKIQNRINAAICRKALQGTKFEPALPLLQSRSSIGFCSNTDVPKLLKLLKKIPQFILLGLIIEDRLMHRADIEAFAKLPNLTSLQCTLCSILTSASNNIPSVLQANQLQLSRNLALHSSST